jgi:hypothetical protein
VAFSEFKQRQNKSMIGSRNRPTAEEKLSRKRLAARLRQQACRARKRKMLSQTKKQAMYPSMNPFTPAMRNTFLIRNSYVANLLSPRTRQEAIQPAIVTPSSAQNLSLNAAPGGKEERRNAYLEAFGLTMPFIPYSTLLSTRNLLTSSPDHISNHQVHLEPDSEDSPSFEQQPLLRRHVDYNAHPPTKRIFARREANESESASTMRQGSALYKVHARLPLSGHPLQHRHRRTLSYFDRVEAVDAILSLKSSNPVY